MACGCVSAADALSVRALRMASSGSLLVRRYTPGYVLALRSYPYYPIGVGKTGKTAVLLVDSIT